MQRFRGADHDTSRTRPYQTSAHSRSIQSFSEPQTDEDWDLTQKAKAAQEVLGISLEISPLEQFADQIQSVGAVSTLEAENLIGEKIFLAGMRQAFRRFRNKSDQMLGLLTMKTWKVRFPCFFRRISFDNRK